MGIFKESELSIKEGNYFISIKSVTEDGITTFPKVSPEGYVWPYFIGDQGIYSYDLLYKSVVSLLFSKDKKTGKVSPVLDLTKEGESLNFTNKELCQAPILLKNVPSQIKPPAKTNFEDKELEVDGTESTTKTKRTDLVDDASLSKGDIDFDLESRLIQNFDDDTIYLYFLYERKKGSKEVVKEITYAPEKIISTTVNASNLLWLYYYERMGIFKILGALLDDHNYKGKFTLKGFGEGYSELLFELTNWYKQGLGSSQKDRQTAYMRVLGLSLPDGPTVETTQNTALMANFDKMLEQMREYYKARQITTAITTATTGGSTVTTKSSIKNSVRLIQENLEPITYGSNLYVTCQGIVTVYITIALINLIRNEIGIPNQYNSPYEFIPAAYDILVAKKPINRTSNSRFTVYDSCASYGYRIMKDAEQLKDAIAISSENNSEIDVWLNDIEEWVESYYNAVNDAKQIPD